MRTIIFALIGVILVGLAVWAYRENYRTKEALDEIHQLRQDIEKAGARLRRLNAEWAYQNRPDRLTQLVDRYYDELQLFHMTADNFARVDQIPYPETTQVRE